MHLQQLSFQRDQAVRSADDCRKKYIASANFNPSFRKLAAERRIASPEEATGPFKLWCDDLRPANILVDSDHRIVGVVDWEFTYVAPAEFRYSPPWWLLLIMPEERPEGLDDWTAKYEHRLMTFLRALDTKEFGYIEQGRLKEAQGLSRHMHRNWETGDFWLPYAARKSWAFDGIIWRSLNERFFGPSTSDPMESLKLSSSEQVAASSALVGRKMQEKDECSLIDRNVEDAASKLPPDILNVG